MSLKGQISYIMHIFLKVFRRIYWKHGTLLQINFGKDALIIIYGKGTNILEDATRLILLKVTLRYFGFNFNNNVTFTCRCTFQQLCYIHLQIHISTTMSYPPADSHLNKNVIPPADSRFGPSQASKMELFTKIVNGFKWTFLTIFARSS